MSIIFSDPGSLTSVELAHARTDFDREFDETCKIEQVDSLEEIQKNGTITPEARSTIYEGRCTIVPVAARRDRYDTYGEATLYQFQYRVALPYTATGIKVGHLFNMVTSTDPDLVGREMEVRDVHRVTDLAQRRITVHDLSD